MIRTDKEQDKHDVFPEDAMESQVAPLHAVLELNTDLLLNCLAARTAEELRRPKVHGFPMEDTTELGLIAFLTQHDSYHIGQMAFLRRQLGKPAMAYTRGARLRSG